MKPAAAAAAVPSSPASLLLSSFSSSSSSSSSSSQPPPVVIYTLPVLKVLILSLICILAFLVRLFAVIRFESVIHEFDPYFNYRTTQVLAKEGFYEWWNWFDTRTWYPLGRVVGQTLYPGLMTTAYAMFRLLHFVGFNIEIRDVCVFTAPIFSAFTGVAAYCLTAEATGKSSAGLFSAAFVVLAPSYMSRSVAGSYDNEAVAIFALVFAFYAYVRAVRRGTAFSALLAALAYFYMVASWGGYVLITNIVAIHTLILLLLGKITVKHYVVYSVFHLIGTLFCLNIPFVNFQAISSAEHMGSHAIFVLLQVIFLLQALRHYFPSPSLKPVIKTSVGLTCVVLFIGLLWLSLTGRTRFAGRSMTLIDPTYSSKYIPIIASVSEHQPPLWTSFIFDLNLCIFIMPVGLWLVFIEASDTSLFLGIYGLLSVYFSCVMVRLLLVLCPAAAVLSGLGVSYIVNAVIPKASEVRLVINRMLSENKDFFASPQSAPTAKAAKVAEAKTATAQTSAGETEEDEDQAANEKGEKQKGNLIAETTDKNKTVLKKSSAKVSPLLSSNSSNTTSTANSTGSAGVVAKSAAAAITAKQMNNRDIKRSSRATDDSGGGSSAAAAASGSDFTSFTTADLMFKIFVGIVILYGLLYLTVCFVTHSVFASAAAYSHPSIILNTHLKDGSRFIQDDFREAYYWFRQNTHEDARVLSWWDYGYQSTAMGDRTVIVDNNTWNNTHIATVGLALSSPEEIAYPILLKLDVDYVFVIFGGHSQFSGDDLNKFLWIIRIASNLFPTIREEDFYSSKGEFSVGEDAAPALRNSLLYRLSYYRFEQGPNEGYDSVRRQTIASVDPLRHLEEVYTTENWLVRVYKVKNPDPFILKQNSISITDA